ncbi:MAG TPA: sugar phosphate isomerase/epimerase [Opitutaceae bacterium]|nr:sugar phosphate isomerase/epimerase [Opitutaceae bacterium]
MKPLLLALLCAASAAASTVTDHLGLQMYSLRVQSMQQGWRAGLDQARALGFKVIEGGGPPKNVTVDAYRAELAARGLALVSAGFPYERLAKDIAGAVALARDLGVKYAAVAWIPHSDADPFTDADARKAAADFNAWGAAFKAAGITFAYHPHGYEFRPDVNGDTPFDVLVRSTNPQCVFFELDVFWATHGGQNPTALLAKYPGRWKLMHVKDIRKGAPTGIYTGHAPGTDDVPVGSGQVDWPSVLKEARSVGVEWYFIEDESPTPLQNIPQSIAYLKSLGP